MLLVTLFDSGGDDDRSGHEEVTVLWHAVRRRPDDCLRIVRRVRKVRILCRSHEFHGRTVRYGGVVLRTVAVSVDVEAVNGVVVCGREVRLAPVGGGVVPPVPPLVPVIGGRRGSRFAFAPAKSANTL